VEIKEKMTLKSYRILSKKKKKKKKKSELMTNPIKSGVKLGLGFAALGLGLSALDRS